MDELAGQTHESETAPGHLGVLSWLLPLKGNSISSHHHETWKTNSISFSEFELTDCWHVYHLNKRWKVYHERWQVLRSVMTVTNMTLFWRLCHLRTHRGMCCIRGWTLMMMSGLYFFRPASTCLHSGETPGKFRTALPSPSSPGRFCRGHLKHNPTYCDVYISRH